jgi:polar amino acid transport system substrate-binding protein
MGEKKFLIIFVALAACALIVAGCINATSEKPVVQEKRVAIVSGHTDWAPIMYVSKDGTKIEGIGVNVTREVFKSFGADIDPKNVGSWDVVQEKLKTGEVDAAVGIYMTEARKNYLYYSISYARDPVVLFLKSGHVFDYTGKDSLVGKKGAATIGDSYGQEMDDYIIKANLNVVRVDTPTQAFNMLKEEKVDYFIYSQSAGRKVINESGLTGFTESGVVSEQLFYIGVSKKSPYAANMQEINNKLRVMIASNQIPTS